MFRYLFTDPEERAKAGKTVFFKLTGVYQWDTEEDNALYYNGPMAEIVVYAKTPVKLRSTVRPAIEELQDYLGIRWTETQKERIALSMGEVEGKKKTDK